LRHVSLGEEGDEKNVPQSRDDTIGDLIKIIHFEMIKEKVLNDKKIYIYSLHIQNCISLRVHVKNDFIPKFDKCKKIAKKRLEYFSLGGRDDLKVDRTISFSKNASEFDMIDKQWDKRLTDWKTQIAELRNKFPMLSYYTVNDMLFLRDLLLSYNQRAEKAQFLGPLVSKISFIDPNVTTTEIETAIKSIKVAPFFSS
ncbi:hypothetical protein RFI_19101, partial [Reticulomyxa filosa]